MRVLRLIRIFRLFKFGRYSKSIQLFALVLTKSKNSISIFFVMLFVALVFFSSFIYIFEGGTYNEFTGKFEYSDGTETLYTSIPASMWWGIVTMATIGYGDMYPKTVGGRIVGFITVITGIFVIVLPVGIVCNEFTKLYGKKMKQKN